MTAASLSCRDLIEFLGRYLDGELTSEEQVRFDAHLAVCPYCVDYLESYRRSIHAGRRAFAEDAEILEKVPEQLIEAVLASRTPRR